MHLLLLFYYYYLKKDYGDKTNKLAVSDWKVSNYRSEKSEITNL